jgi:hypothetical protein
MRGKEKKRGRIRKEIPCNSNEKFNKKEASISFAHLLQQSLRVFTSVVPKWVAICCKIKFGSSANILV